MKQMNIYITTLFILFFVPIIHGSVTWQGNVSSNVTDNDIVLNGTVNIANGVTVHAQTTDITISLARNSSLRNAIGSNATLHLIADIGRKITFMVDGMKMTWRSEGNFTFTVSEEGAGEVIKTIR